jgi:large conductance mechanosensitive channel
MLQDFKNFINRGNVLDLAVGVIIGAAFSKIVDSVVGDLINPLIGRLLGTPDFSSLMIPLATIPPELVGKPYAEIAKAVPVLGVGQFITVVFNFLILALVIFWIVRLANRLAPKPVAAPPPPAVTAEEVVLLRDIRDLLRSQKG